MGGNFGSGSNRNKTLEELSIISIIIALNSNNSFFY